MKEALPKLDQKTLTGSPSVIFSLVSEAGLSRSDLREFRKIRLSGREARLANRLARQENNLDSSTRDTSRQSSSTSSASAALQSSLGNRLRQQLRNRGCAIYKLTWKEKTTPSGLPYSQLVASALRIKETDFSLERACWPTPRARDYHTEGAGKHSPSLARLAEAVSQRPSPVTIKPNGKIATAFYAPIKNSGQLDPDHSRWLMGFPPEWDDCAVTAMPSSRK